MPDFIYFGAILFLGLFGVVVCFAIIVAAIETITGTVISQWPEKIRSFFKKGAKNSKTKSQI